jgi:teichuronic acid biosynthesis glycosyltransferase TuaC
MTRPLEFLVVSSLFPSLTQPSEGGFILARLKAMNSFINATVVAPHAWSPIDPIARLIRPTFRQVPTGAVKDSEIPVVRPPYFCIPAFGKSLDGESMHRAILPFAQKANREKKIDWIDGHFVYPDGYAAMRVAQKLGVPFSITVRGSKDQRLLNTDLRPKLAETLKAADRIICVSQQLAQEVVIPFVGNDSKVRVIPNGVDLSRFKAIEKVEARQLISQPLTGKLLLSVGGLTDLKGHHRLIAAMPTILQRQPDCRLMIVGGGTSHDDMTQKLQSLIAELNLQAHVQLLGRKNPEELSKYYSAADLLVSATAFEGWANVYLEAMACGTPVVTTKVGGNQEVVSNENVGHTVPFWDENKFAEQVLQCLAKEPNRQAILQYANDSSWEARKNSLFEAYQLAN